MSTGLLAGYDLVVALRGTLVERIVAKAWKTDAAQEAMDAHRRKSDHKDLDPHPLRLEYSLVIADNDFPGADSPVRVRLRAVAPTEMEVVLSIRQRVSVSMRLIPLLDLGGYGVVGAFFEASAVVEAEAVLSLRLMGVGTAEEGLALDLTNIRDVTVRPIAGGEPLRRLEPIIAAAVRSMLDSGGKTLGRIEMSQQLGGLKRLRGLHDPELAVRYVTLPKNTLDFDATSGFVPRDQPFDPAAYDTYLLLAVSIGDTKRTSPHPIQGRSARDINSIRLPFRWDPAAEMTVGFTNRLLLYVMMYCVRDANTPPNETDRRKRYGVLHRFADEHGLHLKFVEGKPRIVDARDHEVLIIEDLAQLDIRPVGNDVKMTTLIHTKLVLDGTKDPDNAVYLQYHLGGFPVEKGGKTRNVVGMLDVDQTIENEDSFWEKAVRAIAAARDFILAVISFVLGKWDAAIGFAKDGGVNLLFVVTALGPIILLFLDMFDVIPDNLQLSENLRLPWRKNNKLQLELKFECLGHGHGDASSSDPKDYSYTVFFGLP